MTSAKAAGITILSEVGLDPGIDHFLAMNCIDSVREQGGQVSLIKFEARFASLR